MTKHLGIIYPVLLFFLLLSAMSYKEATKNPAIIYKKTGLSTRAGFSLPYYCVRSKSPLVVDKLDKTNGRHPTHSSCIVNHNYILTNDTLMTEFEVHQIFDMASQENNAKTLLFEEHSNIELSIFTYNLNSEESLIWEENKTPIVVGKTVLHFDRVKLQLKTNVDLYSSSGNDRTLFQKWTIHVDYVSAMDPLRDEINFRCLIPGRHDQTFNFKVKLSKSPERVAYSKRNLLTIKRAGDELEERILNITCSLLVSNKKANEVIIEWTHAGSHAEIPRSWKNFYRISSNGINQLEISKSFQIYNRTHRYVMATLSFLKLQPSDAGLYNCLVLVTPKIIFPTNPNIMVNNVKEDVMDCALYNLEVKRRWPNEMVHFPRSLNLLTRFMNQINNDFSPDAMTELTFSEVQLNDQSVGNDKQYSKSRKFNEEKNSWSYKDSMNNSQRLLSIRKFIFTIIISVMALNM